MQDRKDWVQILPETLDYVVGGLPRGKDPGQGILVANSLWKGIGLLAAPKQLPWPTSNPRSSEV